jgi:hypothetical protein
MPSDDFIENFLKVGRPVLMKRATLSGPTGLGVLLRISVLKTGVYLQNVESFDCVSGHRLRPNKGGERTAAADENELTEESTWEAWRASMAKQAFLASHGERVFATSAIPCEPPTTQSLAGDLFAGGHLVVCPTARIYLNGSGVAFLQSSNRVSNGVSEHRWCHLWYSNHKYECCRVRAWYRHARKGHRSETCRTLYLSLGAIPAMLHVH